MLHHLCIGRAHGDHVAGRHSILQTHSLQLSELLLLLLLLLLRHHCYLMVNLTIHFYNDKNNAKRIRKHVQPPIVR
jgi:hypothetical protein